MTLVFSLVSGVAVTFILITRLLGRTILNSIEAFLELDTALCHSCTTSSRSSSWINDTQLLPMISDSVTPSILHRV